MASKKLLVSFVALLALVVLSVTNVSAGFAQIVDLEVAGVDVLESNGASINQPVAVFAGEEIPVRVAFMSIDNTRDVRVRARIAGERELSIVSERFAVVEENKTYSRTFMVKVPSDLTDELFETIELEIDVESRNQGESDSESVLLTIQRESYDLRILDVDVMDQVRAGEILPVDVVVKNRGFEFADDTFVRARIPALGIEDKAFVGDLSFLDQPFTRDPFVSADADELNGDDRLDKEDSAETRLFLRIPSNAPAGAYVVEIDAYNADSIATTTEKVVISGAEASTRVVVPTNSKSFGVGEKAEYSLVLVNSGTQTEVLELVVESTSDLSVSASDPIVALPAGTSKTVKLEVTSDKEGTYSFAVNIHSGAELVKRETFTATVSSNGVTASSAVILTVVLAVVFIVLLIVLIVLLTRKPERKNEAGESYY